MAEDRERKMPGAWQRYADADVGDDGRVVGAIGESSASSRDGKCIES